MTHPEDPNVGTGGGAAPDPVVENREEVHIVISDMHLSEGAVIAAREERSFWRRVRDRVSALFGKTSAKTIEFVQNPLEDFPHDDIFSDFIADIAAYYADIPHLRLRLMGDVFDPLAVRWKGRFTDQPYERVAVYKMERIISGHRTFFDALARFIRLPNAHVDFFGGNHDQFLAWPAVQEAIAARLCGDDAALRAKLRFVDQSMDFTDVHRGVLYYHGMNAEPSNAIDPKSCILTHRFGITLDEPILNMPLGSYMTIRVVNAIKLKNPFVGRLPVISDVWKNAALHRWGWALYAGIMLFWTFVHSQLFAFWNIRRKSSIWMTLKIMLATIADDSVDRYAQKVLNERDGINVVVMGHSHEWRRVSTQKGTYINTGTWSLLFALDEPKFELRWKRWRKLETAWRVLIHFLTTGEIKFAAQFTKLVGFAAIVGAMATFLATNFPLEEGWRIWTVPIADLKVPIAILLVFVLLSGLIRIFAVKPKVRTSLKLTFARIWHSETGEIKADLKEYLHAERQFRECV